MASKLAHAVSILVTECPHVAAVQDLLTKTRVELNQGYLLDLFYNDTLGKYAYALILNNQRVVGWDNAPHHDHLPTAPHHFHAEDGSVQPSTLVSDPEQEFFKLSPSLTLSSAVSALTPSPSPKIGRGERAALSG